MLALTALLGLLGPTLLLPPHFTKFDFWPSYEATDRDWFYMNPDGTAKPAGGGVFPEPEYTTLREFRVWPVVMQRGSPVALTVDLYNPNGGPNSTLYGYILIDNFTFTSSDPNIGTAYLTGDLYTAFEIGPTGTESWNILIEDFPDVVAKGLLTMDVYCYSTAGGPIDTFNMATCYLVDAAPTGWMTVPWQEVLEYACGFASNKSGKASVLEHCTKGLYDSGVFRYLASTLPHWIHRGPATDEGADPNDGKFKLKELIVASKPASADCRDVSSFLSLTTSSLGHALPLIQAWTGMTVGGEAQLFRTNEIKPVGGSSYSQVNWHYHQVATDNSMVYDACAAFYKDLAGQSYNSVPYGWAQSGYWQTASGNEFVGLVRGYPGGEPEEVSPRFQAAKLRGPVIASPTILQGVK